MQSCLTASKKTLLWRQSFYAPIRKLMPNGGFEITIKAAVFFFKSKNTEDVLKSPFYEDIRDRLRSRLMRAVLSFKV